MRNFEYASPTRIIFGKGSHATVGESIKPLAGRVLLHYGGKSLKASGAYAVIVDSLRGAGIEFEELGGVQPNPRVEKVREGIALCREKNLQLILAVGGGSVIDSAKAIGMGTLYEGDVWDIYQERLPNRPCLPIVTILTIPAAGSETSPSSVITQGDVKLGHGEENTRPVLSILNPELCYTLPRYQLGCGVSDMLAHMMERYFTNTTECDYTDRALEAGMRSLICTAPRLLDDSRDYEAWANVMWAGTMAHNDILGVGREGDWGSHNIEHELSAAYDIAHGAGLSIVFPAWIKAVYRTNPARFVQWAQRVWDVDLPCDQVDAIIREGVRRMEEFFLRFDLPVRMRQAGLDDARIEHMAQRSQRFGALGNLKKLDAQCVREILTLAL